MTEYLLDTTVLIQQFRGSPRVRAWIAAAIAEDHALETTPVNVAEVMARAHPNEEPYWEAVFGALTIPALSAEHGARAGALQFQLARRGFTLNTADGLIAAVAAERDLTLVTANTKDFLETGIHLLPLDGDA
ncbi:MAG: PIN domain-containing protein [bacterium]